jgi:hypothetical protein
MENEKTVSNKYLMDLAEQAWNLTTSLRVGLNRLSKSGNLEIEMTYISEKFNKLNGLIVELRLNEECIGED